jgi:hypothetical protein
VLIIFFKCNRRKPILQATIYMQAANVLLLAIMILMVFFALVQIALVHAVLAHRVPLGL